MRKAALIILVVFLSCFQAFATSSAIVLEAIKPYTLNSARGKLGEGLSDSYFSRLDNKSWTKLTPRKGSQGIDHLYLKYDKKGHVRGMIVGESKFGSSKLGMTKDGEQMGQNWVRNRLKSYLDNPPQQLTRNERQYFQAVIDGKIDYRGRVVRTEYVDGKLVQSVFDSSDNKLIERIIVNRGDIKAFVSNSDDLIDKLASAYKVKPKDMKSFIRSSNADDVTDLIRNTGKESYRLNGVRKLESSIFKSRLVKGSIAVGAIAGIADFGLQMASNGGDLSKVDYIQTGFRTGTAVGVYATGQILSRTISKTSLSTIAKGALQGFGGAGVFVAFDFVAETALDAIRYRRGAISYELKQLNTERNAKIAGASVVIGGIVTGLYCAGSAIATAFSGGAASPSFAAAPTVFSASTAVGGVVAGFFFKPPAETDPKTIWKKYYNSPEILSSWVDI